MASRRHAPVRSRQAERRPRSTVPRRSPRGRFSLRAQQARARVRLRTFRQGSALAVAMTALLLMVTGVDDSAGQQAQPDPPAAALDPGESIAQVVGTTREVLLAFYAVLPKLAFALLLIGATIIAARITSAILRRTLREWEKADAVSALVRLALYLAATAVSLAILAGDVAALLGSLGLVGLALSWALQTPIESFTGWLLNSFRSYYRVGDRIEVGDVFGDVYRIDVLTTTVWEAGGPGKAVGGAQPTGAMITFPNWEVLRSNIINYSRDFPFVWDEVTVTVGNESDLPYTARVLERTAGEVIGAGMRETAKRYEALLSRARIAFDVDDEPRVFFSAADAWTNCTVRYLVDARTRRRIASDLVVALAKAMADRTHQGRIVGAYPRSEVRLRRTWHQGDPARDQE